jgi:hypothetical protein
MDETNWTQYRGAFDSNGKRRTFRCISASFGLRTQHSQLSSQRTVLHKPQDLQDSISRTKNTGRNSATGGYSSSGGTRRQSSERHADLKDRYPDASVPISVVQEDIANLSAAGAGGLEFLPFYLYGLTSGLPPTNWSIYGYGTEAYTQGFRAALEAAKDNNLLFDFAVGANQGQGAPAVPGSKGLAVQLVCPRCLDPLRD